MERQNQCLGSGSAGHCARCMGDPLISDGRGEQHAPATASCGSRLSFLELKIQDLERKLLAGGASSSTMGRGCAEGIDELMLFVRRNTVRLLSKIVAECKPKREILTAKNSLQQLLRKSEKVSCSFLTMQNLVKSVMQSNPSVQVYPAKRFIIGAAPTALTRVQIVFKSFKDLCEYTTVPCDVRERACFVTSFDVERRASHVQVVGSLLDVSHDEGADPRRSILVGASICAPASSNVVELQQPRAVWSEMSWDTGFSARMAWQGPSEEVRRNEVGTRLRPAIKNFDDSRLFSLEWQCDRESRGQLVIENGKFITGELKIKIPVVAIRCPVVSSSIRDHFSRSGGNDLLREVV